MEKRKRLPVGVDHFKKIRQQGFYYIDKTNLIKELITNWGEVNLFTRPRRFGKSLSLNNEKILETLINRAFPGTRSSI